MIVCKIMKRNRNSCNILPSLNWYSYSGHLEKSVIETKLLEVRCENNKKELFKAI
jgi:hypothetical protein